MSIGGLRPPEAGEPEAGELFAALPVAALVVAPDGCVRRANMLAEQMLNRSERSMSGRPLDALLPIAGYPHDHALAVYDAEIRTAGGGRLRVDLAEAQVAERPGWRTMTLHPSAASRGPRPAERGGRAAIGAAAMLAHEIRNPLAGIRGAAQLLGKGDLTELIVAEVDRIVALIDRMEAFGDDRPPPLGPENIYPVIAHALAVARTGFAADVTVEERFDPSLPPALVSRDALVQVLLNLLRNAVEATREVARPRIMLATAYRHGVTRSEGGGRVALPIEITVSDNGPGAPADIADHLFQPFVSGRPEGTGLGLALVDKLVADMGGLVQYSREGEPAITAFRLLLPRAA